MSLPISLLISAILISYITAPIAQATSKLLHILPSDIKSNMVTADIIEEYNINTAQLTARFNMLVNNDIEGQKLQHKLSSLRGYNLTTQQQSGFEASKARLLLRQYGAILPELANMQKLGYISQAEYNSIENTITAIIQSDGFQKIRQSPEMAERLRLELELIEQARTFSNGFANLEGDITTLLNSPAWRQAYFASELNRPVKLDNFSPIESSDAPITDTLLSSIKLTADINQQAINTPRANLSQDRESYQLWLAGLDAAYKQRSGFNRPGYNLLSNALSFGCQSGEGPLLGASYNYFLQNIKYTPQAKNNSNLETSILALYGKINMLRSNYFMLMATIGSSNIATNRSCGDLLDNIAVGKMWAKTYGLQFGLYQDLPVRSRLKLAIKSELHLAATTIDKYTEKSEGLARAVGKRHGKYHRLNFGINAQLQPSHNLLKNTRLTAGVTLAIPLYYQSSPTIVTFANGINPLSVKTKQRQPIIISFSGEFAIARKDDATLSAAYHQSQAFGGGSRGVQMALIIRLDI